MSDRRRQRLRAITTIVVTALVIAPAAALATHSFTDVNNSDFFHAAVDWMDENDVTAGCNPPSNTRFCPDDFVTRGQMAVFLERLDSENVFVRPGDDAVDGGNADTVDGKHASAFLGVNAKAADADKLDGKDSTAFTTDTELASAFADLDAFVPIAVITIINGSFVGGEPGSTPNVANFRTPLTGPPTYQNTGTGEYTIDLPGIIFSDAAYPVVCSSVSSLNIVTTRPTPPGPDRDLIVTLYDEDGSAQSDVSKDDFNCVVYEGS